MEDLSPKITKRQALEECVELWNWLAEDGERVKSRWFKKRGKNYVCDCPCCHWVFDADDNGKHFDICTTCPISWPDAFFDPEEGACLHSFFGRWHKSYNESEREDLARRIAELAQNALAKLDPNEP